MSRQSECVDPLKRDKYEAKRFVLHLREIPSTARRFFWERSRTDNDDLAKASQFHFRTTNLLPEKNWRLVAVSKK
jgi:hypothetical protein